MRRLLRNRGAIIAFWFLVLLVVVAIVAPLISPADPNEQDVLNRLAGPSADHWLGTDALGRDTLSRLLYSAGITMLASAQGLAISVGLGVPLGLFAGYVGGVIDSVLSRVTDAFLSLPPIIFALGLITALGAGLTNVMIAIGVLLAPRFYRVARAAAESISHEIYIEACRSFGASTPRVLFRHVIPNASGPLLVQASFAVGVIISAEASLSFLGIGVQLPQASWGSMLQTAFQTVSTDSFQLIPPAVMISLTILAFFTIGDALRDALGRGSSGD